MPTFTTRFINTILLFLVAVAFAACDLLEENGEDSGPRVSGVYIANQGNFGDANGTLTFYDPSSGSAQQDVIPNIGSIIQSITVREDRGYIMANTAERVDVFDVEDQTRIAQISDIKSPRYMAHVNDSTAYVTNQSPGTVTIINTENHTKENILKVGSNPEGITVAGGKAYVGNHDFGSGSTVSIIDIDTHLAEGSVDINCDGPRSLISDRQNEVWVFCTGNTIYDENWNIVDRTDGAVRVLDPLTDEVTAEFPIDGQISTAGPGQDVFFSALEQTVYVVVDKERVLRFDTADNSGPADISIAEGDPIGALAYSPHEDLLYVGRTPGFETSGVIEQYTPGDTTVVNSFEAGVAPTYIAIETSLE